MEYDFIPWNMTSLYERLNLWKSLPPATGLGCLKRRLDKRVKQLGPATGMSGISHDD